MLAVVAALVFLHSPLASAQPTQEVQDAALFALVEDLSKRVITITKPVYVYHWRALSREFLNADTFEVFEVEQLVHKKVSEIGNRYWESMEKIGEDTVYGLVGGGLYAARDPVSSSGFGSWPGGDEVLPLLVSIRIDPGAKLFDLRLINGVNHKDYVQGNQIYIHDKTVAKLRELSCYIGKKEHIKQWLFSSTCAVILGKAFKKLGIIGNVHSWWSGPIHNCYDNSDTFALFDERYLNEPGRIRVYTKKSIQNQNFISDPEVSTEWNSIQEMLTENATIEYPSGSVREASKYLGLTKLADPNKDNEDRLKIWMNSHLFHCDEEQKEEKATFPPWSY